MPAATFGSDGYLLHVLDDEGRAMCDEEAYDELTIEPATAWRDPARQQCPACEQLASAHGID